MNAKLTEIALRMDLHGDSTAKLALIALASYANDDGLTWPSVATVAAIAGRSKRMVQKSLRELEAWGFIKRADPSAASAIRRDLRPNVYKVLPAVRHQTLLQQEGRMQELAGKEQTLSLAAGAKITIAIEGGRQ